MAQFKIKSLNYIAYGAHRTLVNMDIDRYSAADTIYLLRQEDAPRGKEPISGDVLLEQRAGRYLPYDFISKEFQRRPSLQHALSQEKLSDEIILNEQSRIYEEDDPDRKGYVRLYLESNVSGLHDAVMKFNRERHLTNMTFEFEHDQTNGSLNQLSTVEKLNSMYDITDVAIKSRNYINDRNFMSFDPKGVDTQDIYLPQLTSTNGFCQIGTAAYLLTGKTNNSPDYLRSSLNITDDTFLNSSFHYMTILSGSLPTYVYPSHDQLSVSSYSDFLQLSSIDNIFEPAVNFANVDYNYVVKIPQDGEASQTTDYAQGNVYGYINTTKNMYNATYSMDVTGLSSIHNCRHYVEISKCGTSPYLKYYDAVEYRSKNILFTNQIMPGNYKNVYLSTNFDENTSLLPYQKIETYYPISFDPYKRHKSTLFSVRLKGTSLDEANDQYVCDHAPADDVDRIVTIRKNLRRDITNTIREIAKNVCPVQTQLFEVMFEG